MAREENKGKDMLTILKDEKFRTAVLKAIAEATHEILIATYKMDYRGRLATRHLNAIVEALHRASKRGVKVRCLLNMDRENSTIGRINKRAKTLLIEKGIIATAGPRGRTYHAKIIIVDQCLAFVGSHNLSESSLCRNFEVSLMIDDPQFALELSVIYLKEWGKGK